MRTIRVIALTATILSLIAALAIKIEKDRYERCGPYDFRSILQGCKGEKK